MKDSIERGDGGCNAQGFIIYVVHIDNRETVESSNTLLRMIGDVRITFFK